MYHVADTWPNYEKVKRMIDKRYRDLEGPAPLSNLTVYSTTNKMKTLKRGRGTVAC
jgi:hypothetical protein